MGTVPTPTEWKESTKQSKLALKLAENHVRVGEKVGIRMADIEAQDVADASCWLCGGETQGRGIPVKTAIKDTFTDVDRAKAPGSGSLCCGCAFCLSFSSLRFYSIVATPGKLIHPSRADLRGILLDPPEPPFMICMAVSGQKWVHIKSQIAYSRDNFPVQMEDVTIYVDPAELAEILEPMEELYSGGFSKVTSKFGIGEIETGEYEPWKMQKFGIAKLEKLEEKLASWRGKRIFNLALFVAQKTEEVK